MGSRRLSPLVRENLFPEGDRGPFIPESHRQRPSAPVLDGGARSTGLLEPALRSPLLLVAREPGAMDRQLCSRDPLAIRRRRKVRKEELQEAGIAQLGGFPRRARKPLPER